MKTTDILNLSLNEFEKELSLLNREYIQEMYFSTLRALGLYKEKAEVCGTDEFFGINEYFDNDRKNSKEYKDFLEDLFK